MCNHSNLPPVRGSEDRLGEVRRAGVLLDGTVVMLALELRLSSSFSVGRGSPVAEHIVSADGQDSA